MNRSLVTGASGFIGSHVVQTLKALGPFQITATGRNQEQLATLGVPWVAVDLHDRPKDLFARLGEPELLIHLAWPDLSSYRDPIHIERHLMDSYRFVLQMAEAGAQRIACVGTCYEYGLQDGCLHEGLPTAPVTAYGIAKDCLRRMLEFRLSTSSAELRWLRPFYTYGPGQQKRALIPQLDRAIDAGHEQFPMSGGEQIRDYMEVSDLASAIAKVALQSAHSGVFNICSGQPISVRELVERHINRRQSQIRPDFGHYGYPSHAPMNFWGDTTRLNAALDAWAEGKDQSQQAHCEG